MLGISALSADLFCKLIVTSGLVARSVDFRISGKIFLYFEFSKLIFRACSAGLWPSGRDELPGPSNGCSTQKSCSVPPTYISERWNRFISNDIRCIYEITKNRLFSLQMVTLGVPSQQISTVSPDRLRARCRRRQFKTVL